jgi:superfamily II DNA or RNA helicase
MSEIVNIDKINEVWIRIHCSDESVLIELYEHFTFEVPGFKYTPSYKTGVWDGKIHLFQLGTKKLYLGLLQKAIKFCHHRGYAVSLNNFPPQIKHITLPQLKEFTDSLLLTSKGKPVEVRDYQESAIQQCINSDKSLILSPTSSGKSLIIYCLAKWYQSILENKKVLIIVPTIGLIQQMYADFIDYDSQYTRSINSKMHKISAGAEKYNLEGVDIVISTYQSLTKETLSWFSKTYGCVIVDECHGAKSVSIKGIMEKTVEVPYKFGFTGTLDGCKTHHWVLEGLFGDVKKVISTAELIERNQISDLKIKALILQYNQEECKNNTRLTYQEEIEFIIQHPKRNRMILTLVESLENQNTLLLFNRINTQGKPLFEACKKLFPNRHVLYIAGEIKAEERENIRLFTEQNTNVIIIASVGTTSVGISITNLNNIIFLTPSKSKIRTLQSIGRVLRLHSNKVVATLYDIVDDMSWKKHKNYTLLHFLERLKFYDEEKFNYKLHRIQL